MIITVDKENIFQAIQNTFMIKKQPLGKKDKVGTLLTRLKIFTRKYVSVFF